MVCGRRYVLQLMRRVRSLPAIASGLDTHLDSISRSFDYERGAGTCWRDTGCAGLGSRALILIPTKAVAEIPLRFIDSLF
jgi:hypothetical protein